MTNNFRGISRSALAAAMLAMAMMPGQAAAEEVVKLDAITLDTNALDNGCAAGTTSGSLEECRYRVCFSLVKNLWLVAEAEKRGLEPDPQSLEEQQRDYEKSNLGSNLNFTVLPRMKFQRTAIQLYRDKRAENMKYSFADLWKDVSTSATALDIPERSLRALVAAYGEDEQRFLDFLKMFPADHESAMTRTQNDWERKARRVALEKKICPDDELTSAELERVKGELTTELEMAPETANRMLRERKRDYHVNRYLVNELEKNARFHDAGFREKFLAWVRETQLKQDENIFGK